MKAYEALDILMSLDRETEVVLSLGHSFKTKPPVSGVPPWDTHTYQPTFVPNWMQTPQYNVTCKTVH